ncbi:MAG: hypothetical protein JXB05_16050 [Myxococcaceae bacterium]|nr:hypothetical protein [Myxococcaceae bacterium]
MKKMLTRSVVFAALSLSPVALAQDEAPSAAPAAKPSADAAKSTVDYYLKGQGGGPIILDAKLCTEVGKQEGSTKNECIAEVDTAAGVKANSRVTLWLSYLVPQGDTYEDVQLQVKQGDTVRETKDLILKEGLRSRQWPGVRLNKPGNWTVTLSRGDEILKELQVKVN